MLAGRRVPGIRIAQVRFGNCGGKRQGQAFPNMIGRSQQKLDCEPRPALRIAGITLQAKLLRALGVVCIENQARI